MLAYKFRGADQIPFALDIIVNQRLYCSNPSTFNDPLEGAFSSIIFEGIEHTKKAHDQVMPECLNLCICSLSMTLESYYASGFSGIAIEIDIPKEALEVKVIRYTNYPALGSLAQDDPERAAIESLCMKRKEWSHKKEVRIIIDSRRVHTAPYYRLEVPVHRIIVGNRIEPALLQVLKLVSRDQDINLCGIRLGQEGLETVKIPL